MLVCSCVRVFVCWCVRVFVCLCICVFVCFCESTVDVDDTSDIILASCSPSCLFVCLCVLVFVVLLFCWCCFCFFFFFFFFVASGVTHPSQMVSRADFWCKIRCASSPSRWRGSRGPRKQIKFSLVLLVSCFLLPRGSCPSLSPPLLTQAGLYALFAVLGWQAF